MFKGKSKTHRFALWSTYDEPHCLSSSYCHDAAICNATPAIPNQTVTSVWCFFGLELRFAVRLSHHHLVACNNKLMWLSMSHSNGNFIASRQSIDTFTCHADLSSNFFPEFCFRWHFICPWGSLKSKSTMEALSFLCFCSFFSFQPTLSLSLSLYRFIPCISPAAHSLFSHCSLAGKAKDGFQFSSSNSHAARLPFSLSSQFYSCCGPIIQCHDALYWPRPLQPLTRAHARTERVLNVGFYFSFLKLHESSFCF